MLVKEFMSTEVVTISEDKNMLEVRELMRSSDKRRLPVVDDISRVRGIITDAMSAVLPRPTLLLFPVMKQTIFWASLKYAM